MAITTRTTEDRIEIVGELKHVQVRVATIILDAGIEVTRAYSRYVVAPTDDISALTAAVQAVCNAVHTDDIKAAYRIAVAAANP